MQMNIPGGSSWRCQLVYGPDSGFAAALATGANTWKLVQRWILTYNLPANATPTAYLAAERERLSATTEISQPALLAR